MRELGIKVVNTSEFLAQQVQTKGDAFAVQACYFAVVFAVPGFQNEVFNSLCLPICLSDVQIEASSNRAVGAVCRF